MNQGLQCWMQFSQIYSFRDIIREYIITTFHTRVYLMPRINLTHTIALHNPCFDQNFRASEQNMELFETDTSNPSLLAPRTKSRKRELHASCSAHRKQQRKRNETKIVSSLAKDFSGSLVLHFKATSLSEKWRCPVSRNV